MIVRSVRMLELVFSVLVFLSLISSVSAVAIGASPASLSFSIPRGGSQEQSFQVSTNSQETFPFHVVVSDSLADFLEVSGSGQATLVQPADLLVRASASQLASPGNYTGTITVTSSAVSDSESGMGSVVSVGVVVVVNLEVQGARESFFSSHSLDNESSSLPINSSSVSSGQSPRLSLILLIELFIALLFGIVIFIYLMVRRRRY